MLGAGLDSRSRANDGEVRNLLLYRRLTFIGGSPPKAEFPRRLSVFSGESLMSLISLRAAALVLAAGLGLSACSYDRGYGYGGLSVGYGSAGYCDPYWDDCYSGYGRGGYHDPWYGWYGDYYYPGIGIYIFDRWGRRHRWNDDHRRYWEHRRHNWRDRDWNDRRWERWDGFRGDRRDWRRGDRDRGDWRRDRSMRRDWNENPERFRRDGTRERFEPRMRAEPRVRGESRAPRGEWRQRGSPRSEPRTAEE